MLKKLTLLAMAVAAVVAFAVPATASATPVWTSPGEYTLTGTGGFTTINGGSHANLHAVVHLTNNGPGGRASGTVTSLTITNCTGTGGALEGQPCTATATGLPWTVDVANDGTLRITNVVIDNSFFGGAVKTTLTGTIVAKPNNAEEIESLSLSGEGTEAGGNPATVTGSLSPSEVIGLEGLT